jgi:putative transposase
MEIAVPRDRDGSFEPQVVRKHQTRWEGLDQQIIALYARGLTVRDIQAQLQEIYGVEVSAGLISEVTNEVLDEVKAWQNRPLENMYPVIFLDALMVKMRHDGRVENRAVYVAIGINEEGGKEVLGLWSSANEGAKFWLGVMTELRNRGLRDVYIVCTDGLKGFPDAIGSVFPKAQVQTCIVHMIRASLNYVGWKERKALAADLKPIYRAPTADAAELALGAFRERWPKHQVVAEIWQRNWARVIPFFQFPEEVRKVIYTTNAVESLHASLRKVTKNRGSFPSEEAAFKLLYLALRNASKKWSTLLKTVGPPKDRNRSVIFMLLSASPVRETLQLQYRVFAQPPNSFITVHNLVVFFRGDPLGNLTDQQLSASYFPDDSDKDLIKTLSERDGRIFADGEPLP